VPLDRKSHTGPSSACYPHNSGPFAAAGGNHLPDNADPQVLEDQPVRIAYDPEVDVLRLEFSSAPIEESDEDKPGVVLDYDRVGNLVGMEILDASKRVENPRSVEYAVAA